MNVQLIKKKIVLDNKQLLIFSIFEIELIKVLVADQFMSLK